MTQPGWYPDPDGGGGQRYFDGSKWTDNRSAPQQPYPQPPRKRKVWPWVLLGVFVLLIVLLGSCVAFVGGVANEIAKDPDVTVQPSDGSAPAADAGLDFPGKQQGDTGVMAGDSATSDGVTTTSTPLVRQAQYGNQFLCTMVTIQNGGSENASFNALFDWKLQYPSGAIRDASILGSEADLGSGELAPGGAVSGDVCFENLPTGAAPGTYVVLFDPTFRLSDSRVGWINEL